LGVAIEGDDGVLGLNQVSDGQEQGSFAGAIGAQQGQHLTLLDPQLFYLDAEGITSGRP
jgi:hypothetical protein